MGDVQRAVQILAGTYDKDFISFEVATVTAVDTQNWLCTAQLVSSPAQNVITNIQLTAEVASNGFVQVPKVGSNVILVVTWRNEVYVYMCSEVDALVFHQLNSDNTTYEEFVINCNDSLDPKLPLGIQVIDGGGNGVVITSGNGGTVTNSAGDNGVVINCGKGSVNNKANGIVITNSSNPPSNNSNNVLITCSGKMQLNDGSYGGLVIGGTSTGLQAQIDRLNNQVQAIIGLLSGSGSPPLWVVAPTDGGAALMAAAALLFTPIAYPNADFSNILSNYITHGKSVT